MLKGKRGEMGEGREERGGRRGRERDVGCKCMNCFLGSQYGALFEIIL